VYLNRTAKRLCVVNGWSKTRLKRLVKGVMIKGCKGVTREIGNRQIHSKPSRFFPLTFVQMTVGRCEACAGLGSQYDPFSTLGQCYLQLFTTCMPIILTPPSVLMDNVAGSVMRHCPSRMLPFS